MRKLVFTIVFTISIFSSHSYAKLSTTDDMAKTLTNNAQTASDQMRLKNCIIGKMVSHMERNKSLGNRDFIATATSACEQLYGIKLLQSSIKQLKDLTSPTLNAGKIREDQQQASLQSAIRNCMLGSFIDQDEKRMPWTTQNAREACEKIYGGKLSEKSGIGTEESADAGGTVTQ